MDPVLLASIVAGYIAQGAAAYLGQQVIESLQARLQKMRKTDAAELEPEALEEGSPEDLASAVAQEMEEKPETESEFRQMVTAVEEGLPLPEVKGPGREVPGGIVALESRFYVERGPWEQLARETLMESAGLVRIKAPRQMGKTSLLVRLLDFAQRQGCRTVYMTFQLTDLDRLHSWEKFCFQFCAVVGAGLGVSFEALEQYWGSRVGVLGVANTCTAFFEERVLAGLEEPLVLGLDEVERLFPYTEVATSFLGMLRVWNENAKLGGVWQRLRLVVTHSTESYVVMDSNQSPFNVGLGVELVDWSRDEVMTVAGRVGVDWGESEVGRLMGLVGGHPYLVRLGLYRVAYESVGLEEMLAGAARADGVFGEHLKRQWRNLKGYSELVAVVTRMVETNGPVVVDEVTGFRLRGMGLVDFDGDRVGWRYGMYRTFFKQRLL